MSPASNPKFKNPRAKFNFQGRTCSITGVGSYVPSKVLTNSELEIKVKVPLLGGRLERLMAEKVQAGMDAEHTVGVAWLKEH